MKKQGILIAVYPGMGQEIFTHVYNDYVMVSLSDYRKDNPDYIKTYVEDALRLVTNGENSVCFIDTNTEVIKHLGELQIPFLIFYPGTPKDSILRNLSNIFLKNPSISTGKTIADVILHYDNKIAELRLYNNSIMFTKGIISDEVVKDFIKMDEVQFKDFIKNLAVMKITNRENSNKKTPSERKSKTGIKKKS